MPRPLPPYSMQWHAISPFTALWFYLCEYESSVKSRTIPYQFGECKANFAAEENRCFVLIPHNRKCK